MRLIAALAMSLTLLGACARNETVEPPVELGDFKLGFAVVVADGVQKVPISRDADPEDWKRVLKESLDARLKRYEGGKFYNLGVSVDAYALAPPGIPLVVSPKSALVVSVTVWDDAAQAKLNAEPEQFTIFEGLDGETLMGSGLTRTADEQMAALSFNAARRIERYLADNPQWFGLPPKPGRAAPSAN
ncbi:hypothetical protein [Szabonella alba]|nr:hypothetical protein [Szabonella alba]